MNHKVEIKGWSMKRPILLASFLSLFVSFVCNAAPPKSEPEQIFSIVETLKSLPELDRNSIERALKIKFSTRNDPNQYWSFYEAKIADGPILSFEIAEPQKEATVKDRRATLNLRPSAKITFDDIQERYGQGTIEQIIPGAGPEGLVSYAFPIKDGTLIFSVTAKTHRVRSVVVIKKGMVFKNFNES